MQNEYHLHIAREREQERGSVSTLQARQGPLEISMGLEQGTGN